MSKPGISHTPLSLHVLHNSSSGRKLDHNSVPVQLSVQGARARAEVEGGSQPLQEAAGQWRGGEFADVRGVDRRSGQVQEAENGAAIFCSVFFSWKQRVAGQKIL